MQTVKQIYIVTEILYNNSATEMNGWISKEIRNSSKGLKIGK